MDFKKEFNQTLDNHTRDWVNLAVKVRSSLVLPVCKRYGLRFLVGNGTYFFCKEQDGKDIYYNSGSISHPEFRHEPKVLKALKPVFEVLDQLIDNYSSLGDYVEDVGSEDIKN